MSHNWTWPGSRWWKCDLHTHTPASANDFIDKHATADEWVDAALTAGLQVVAVTDHNTGAWNEDIRRAATGKDLHVFPGVEVMVTPGVHILAIFDPNADAAAATCLLSACGLRPEQIGDHQAITTVPTTSVLAIVNEHAGIAIAAHVDRDKGILTKLGPGVDLLNVLRHRYLLGLEVVGKQGLDDEALGKHAPLLKLIDGSVPEYKREHGEWPQLTFSDAHHLARLGQRATWIKMSSPTLEGMRLALQDGPDSVVNDADPMYADPNRHADLVIESIEVVDGRYMGRSPRPGPLSLAFNPWLNAIIGGRGAGKSSVVEFLRLAMRREFELDKLPELKKAFDRAMDVPRRRTDSGLLRDTTAVRVVYRKGADRFKVQWSKAGDLTAIERIEADGTTASVEGMVKDWFPVRIFSQKQIFEMANQPSALLAIIDEAKEVDGRSLKAKFETELNEFLALRAKGRALASALEELPRTLVALADVNRKLAVFETTQHAATLQAYQRFQRQQTAVSGTVQSLQDGLSALPPWLDGLVPPELPADLFAADQPADQALAARMQMLANDFQGFRSALEAVLKAAADRLAGWQQELAVSPWADDVSRAAEAYQDLVTELQAAQVTDPTEYGRLLQERQLVESRLKSFESARQELANIEGQAGASANRLLKLRRELTQRRQEFLDELNSRNPNVRVQVAAYGASDLVESELRERLALNETTYEKIIGEPGRDAKTFLGDLYPAAIPDEELTKPLQASAFEQRLAVLKHNLATIHGQQDGKSGDQKFAKAIQKLAPEALDRMMAWYPSDSLVISYRPLNQEGAFRSIDQGSAGQKTAALLAFLLSYGDEPMILDQPEDDLDNQLIFELIVSQLRAVKKRRQVIVVTHNANIVVNGDAELVIALGSHKGQTSWTFGGLQERDVRQRICDIMEGGRQAFEQRYRRIALGD